MTTQKITTADDDCTCYGYPAEDGLCDTSGDSTGGSTG